MRVSNPNYSPLAVTADTQPQDQPALLSLSAMISQYRFTRALVIFGIFETNTDQQANRSN